MTGADEVWRIQLESTLPKYKYIIINYNSPGS